MRQDVAAGAIYFPLWIAFLSWAFFRDSFGFLLFGGALLLFSIGSAIKTAWLIPKPINELVSVKEPRTLIARPIFEKKAPSGFERYFPWAAYSVAAVAVLTFVVALVAFVRSPQWSLEDVLALLAPVFFGGIAIAALGSQSLSRKLETRLVECGIVVEGIVNYVSRGRKSSTTSYEYFVDGQRFYGDDLIAQVKENDKVLLLIDPTDPKSHIPLSNLTRYQPAK